MLRLYRDRFSATRPLRVFDREMAKDLERNPLRQLFMERFLIRNVVAGRDREFGRRVAAEINKLVGKYDNIPDLDTGAKLRHEWRNDLDTLKSMGSFFRARGYLTAKQRRYATNLLVRLDSQLTASGVNERQALFLADSPELPELPESTD